MTCIYHKSVLQWLLLLMFHLELWWKKFLSSNNVLYAPVSSQTEKAFLITGHLEHKTFRSFVWLIFLFRCPLPALLESHLSWKDTRHNSRRCLSIRWRDNPFSALEFYEEHRVEAKTYKEWKASVWCMEGPSSLDFGCSEKKWMAKGHIWSTPWNLIS